MLKSRCSLLPDCARRNAVMQRPTSTNPWVRQGVLKRHIDSISSDLGMISLVSYAIHASWVEFKYLALHSPASYTLAAISG